MTDLNSLSSEIGGDDLDALSLGEQEKKHKNNKIKAEGERYSGDTEIRKNLAYWSASLVSIYLLVVFLILVLSSDISENVLITLLTTTTINVLGLMLIVLKGLFEKEKNN